MVFVQSRGGREDKRCGVDWYGTKHTETGFDKKVEGERRVRGQDIATNDTINARKSNAREE
jgi:hypothetical protein